MTRAPTWPCINRFNLTESRGHMKQACAEHHMACSLAREKGLCTVQPPEPTHVRGKYHTVRIRVDELEARVAALEKGREVGA